MPRRDRTFTAADAIRFWGRNLDRREKIIVCLFFHFFTVNIVERVVEERLSTLENLLVSILTGSVFGFVKRALFRRVRSSIVQRILASLLPDEREEILKALDRNPLFQ